MNKTNDVKKESIIQTSVRQGAKYSNDDIFCWVFLVLRKKMRFEPDDDGLEEDGVHSMTRQKKKDGIVFFSPSLDSLAFGGFCGIFFWLFSFKIQNAS